MKEKREMSFDVPIPCAAAGARGAVSQPPLQHTLCKGQQKVFSFAICSPLIQAAFGINLRAKEQTQAFLDFLKCVTKEAKGLGYPSPFTTEWCKTSNQKADPTLSFLNLPPTRF